MHHNSDPEGWHHARIRTWGDAAGTGQCARQQTQVLDDAPSLCATYHDAGAPPSCPGIPPSVRGRPRVLERSLRSRPGIQPRGSGSGSRPVCGLRVPRSAEAARAPRTRTASLWRRVRCAGRHIALRGRRSCTSHSDARRRGRCYGSCGAGPDRRARASHETRWGRRRQYTRRFLDGSRG